MRGKWEKARGKVAESPDAVPGAWPAFSGAREIHGYVVELAGPDGQVLRAPVEMPGIFVRAVGEPLAVEVNFKTGEVRIDRPGMAEILREQAAAEREAARMARLARAGDGGNGGPGGPSSGSPVLPASPPLSAFDTSGGAGSPQERLVRLRQLLDSGILTQTEYDARRKEIASQT